jgi:hypothetical protein
MGALFKLIGHLFILISSISGVSAYYRAKREKGNISSSQPNDSQGNLPPKPQ